MTALPQLPMPSHAKPRPATRETKSFWSAIVRIRRAGFTAYRVSGKQHRVNGRLLTTREVKLLARALP